MNRDILVKRNVTFFDISLPVSCLMLDSFDGVLEESAVSGEPAIMSFRDCGDTMAYLEIAPEVARLLVDKGIDGELLTERCLQGVRSELNDSCESADDGISVVFRITEYRRHVNGAVKLVQNPIRDCPEADVPLGRVVELTAKAA